MREEEAAPKSLAEQLQEHKDAKAAAKEEIARIKKQGKNRPLTEVRAAAPQVKTQDFFGFSTLERAP